MTPCWLLAMRDADADAERVLRGEDDDPAATPFPASSAGAEGGEELL